MSKMILQVTKLCVLGLLAICVCRPVSAQDRVAEFDEVRRLDEEVTRLYQMGRYAEAIPSAEKALAIVEKTLRDHPTTATIVRTLAALHIAVGDYARADVYQQRWLTMITKLAGRDSPTYLADAFTFLSVFYFDRGEYDRAGALLQRALPIIEKAWGPVNNAVAMIVGNLGEVYSAKGDYARAEPFYLRSLAIREKLLSPDHTDVAIVLNNLAGMYLRKGDYAHAAPLYQRTVEILEKSLSKDDPRVATALNNQASLYNVQRDYARAESLYKRALEIRQKKFGDMHPDVANSLSNLALFYWNRGDNERAEAMFQRTLRIFENILNAENSFVAIVLNNLATLYWNRGDYARAEGAYQRAHTIIEKAVGAEHPDIALILSNRATMYWHRGDFAKVLELQQQIIAIEEKNLARNLTTGSQQQKQYYLNTLLGETYSAVTLNVRDMRQSAAAAQLALNVILQRKGRVLDTMSDQITSLRRHATPQDQKLLNQLVATRSRLATLQLSGTGTRGLDERRSEILKLEGEEERLEANISRQSAEFRAVAQPITLDAVRQAIPPDTALVELFVYHPFITKAAERPFSMPRYVAYILRHDESVPRWVELGEAARIDSQVKDLRAALRNPKNSDFKQLARSLDEQVMRPIRQLLGATRRIFLAPDGLLSLIPFASLVDENNHYLIENYSLNYITRGRDLLRLQLSGESREKPMIFADPLYDLTVTGQPRPTDSQKIDSPVESNTNKRRSKDFTALNYRPLLGTAAEGAALNKLFPDASVLMQEHATEAVLKRVHRPSFLHIATHGFFLNDQSQPAISLTQGFGFDLGRDTEVLVAATNENPLLRSGLIFAGVKQQSSGAGEDGVLTALEVAGLDLWGTKLVVLSACVTGLGDVKDGAGVYGLRRALVLAGSETQVMSLWKVSDAGTRDLMTAYYTRLKAGEGRTEALRQVQLEMLRGKLMPAVTMSIGRRETSDAVDLAPNNYRHPYYWAAFIPSGDWRSMAGK